MVNKNYIYISILLILGFLGVFLILGGVESNELKEETLENIKSGLEGRHTFDYEVYFHNELRKNVNTCVRLYEYGSNGWNLKGERYDKKGYYRQDGIFENDQLWNDYFALPYLRVLFITDTGSHVEFRNDIDNFGLFKYKRIIIEEKNRNYDCIFLGQKVGENIPYKDLKEWTCDEWKISCYFNETKIDNLLEELEDEN